MRLREPLRRAWSCPRGCLGGAGAGFRPSAILGRAWLFLLGILTTLTGATMSERMTHLPTVVGAGLARVATPAVRWLALLALCAAYLQGGLTKALDFPVAIAEMNHFGLAPAAPMAALVIALELGASAMILTGFGRWLGALALAAFTLMRRS